MSQLGFFAAQPLYIVRGERGDVTYVPNVISEATATSWFDYLHTNVDWRGERRRMYDRDVDTPRLMSSYRLDADDLPNIIIEAFAIVSQHFEAPFNRVGLNLYRDGRDSVAPHNDHLDDLAKHQPIVLLSLGATRRMTIQEKEHPRTSRHINLEAGSLFYMSYATQLHYLHGIPKMQGVVHPRISLAFRVHHSAIFAVP